MSRYRLVLLFIDIVNAGFHAINILEIAIIQVLDLWVNIKHNKAESAKMICNVLHVV